MSTSQSNEKEKGIYPSSLIGKNENEKNHDPSDDRKNEPSKKTIEPEIAPKIEDQKSELEKNAISEKPSPPIGKNETNEKNHDPSNVRKNETKNESKSEATSEKTIEPNIAQKIEDQKAMDEKLAQTNCPFGSIVGENDPVLQIILFPLQRVLIKSYSLLYFSKNLR